MSDQASYKIWWRVDENIYYEVKNQVNYLPFNYILEELRLTQFDMDEKSRWDDLKDYIHEVVVLEI